MPGMEELARRFQGDRFAALAGVEIREAEPGRAVCAMPLEDRHMNANGVPMGGAVFTLADFTYAVASNAFTEQIIVSQQVSISFLAPAKGKVLLADRQVQIFGAGGGHMPEIRTHDLSVCRGCAGRDGGLRGPCDGERICGEAGAGKGNKRGRVSV